MLDKKVGVDRSDTEVIDTKMWGIQHLIPKKQKACIAAMRRGEEIDDFAQNKCTKVEARSNNWSQFMKVTQLGDSHIQREVKQLNAMPSQIMAPLRHRSND
jgi:hypothetical protein